MLFSRLSNNILSKLIIAIHIQCCKKWSICVQALIFFSHPGQSNFIIYLEHETSTKGRDPEKASLLSPLIENEPGKKQINLDNSRRI